MNRPRKVEADRGGTHPRNVPFHQVILVALSGAQEALCGGSKRFPAWSRGFPCLGRNQAGEADIVDPGVCFAAPRFYYTIGAGAKQLHFLPLVLHFGFYSPGRKDFAVNSVWKNRMLSGNFHVTLPCGICFDDLHNRNFPFFSKTY